MTNRLEGPALDVREGDGHTTAIITGCTQLIDGTAEQLGKQLAALIDGPTPKDLVVDLAGVDFVSSAALAQFLGLHRSLKAAGRHLRLQNLHPDVREVFAVTKIDHVIEVHSTEP
jgi:anti-anti-sigma factor